MSGYPLVLSRERERACGSTRVFESRTIENRQTKRLVRGGGGVFSLFGC